MNIKVKSMQSGGGMPPFTYYQPITINNAQAAAQATEDTSSKKDSSEKTGLKDLDLLSLLKGEMLPSDRQLIGQGLEKLYAVSDGTLDPSTLATQYIRLTNQLNTGKFNLEKYNKTFEIVNNNNGLNEYAITSTGRVVVNSKDGIQQVSLQELKNNPDKYAPITNAELLHARAYNIPMDNSILDTVANGIGMEKVNEYINNIAEKLGTSELNIGGYVSKGEKMAQEGIAVLQQMAEKGLTIDSIGALDGLYKTKTITKEQQQQIKYALKYIESTLPNNMKTLLQLKSDLTPNGMRDLILTSLLERTDTTFQFDPTMIVDAEGNKLGSNGTKEDSNNEKADLLTNISRGTGGTQSQYQILNSDGYNMSVNSVSYPSLTLDPSHPVESGTLDDLLGKYNYNALAKGGNWAITFGSQVLKDSDYDDITFSNDQQASRVLLPIKIDETTQKVVPDLDFLNQHKDLVNFINSKGGNMNDPAVKEALVKAGVINEITGIPDTSKFQTYLCINGHATSRNIKNQDFVQKVSEDELDSAIKRFEALTHRDKNSSKGEYNFDFDQKSWYNPIEWLFESSYDQLYEGTIFIPITENQLQTKIGSGTDVKEPAADMYEDAYQIGELNKYANPTKSSVLFE